jgi:hypothetical protein
VIRVHIAARRAFVLTAACALLACSDESEAPATAADASAEPERDGRVAALPEGRMDASTPGQAEDGGLAADDGGAATDAGASGPANDAGTTPPVDPDAAPNASDAATGVCAVVNARAEAALRPVDILWVIDSSPSMDDEIAIIQAELNAFTMRLGASGLNAKVALVGADRDLATPGRDYFGICIPPPLSGAPGCPDTDSEQYLHVRAPVHSSDALDVLLANAEPLRNFLRPAARLHVVVVSDDDHRNDIGLGDLVGAGLGADLLFHSVVTLLDYVGGCGVFDPDEECSCGDERGRQYIGLSEQTGGLVLDLCSEDWAPLFEGLEEEVQAGAGIPCAFDIPEVRGAVVDPERVNVDFVAPDGTRTALFNVDDCAAHPGGWRFDDPEDPTRLILCPDACGEIEGEVEVEFGCEIRKIP